MTINYIWWWGSSTRNLESVEYHFIVIIAKSTLTWSGCIFEGFIHKLNRIYYIEIVIWLQVFLCAN